MPADAPNSPAPPEGVVKRLAVGRFVLVLGNQDGTAIEPGSREAAPRELVQALAAKPNQHQTSSSDGASFASTVEDASQATDKAERALTLFTEIAQGRLDPTSINDELDALLGLLGRLDRDEHWGEALRVARSVAMLLALLRRWVELLRSLQIALSAAERLGDASGQAWALHELGTLHLAAERYADGDRLLSQAHDLRERLGERRPLAITDRNLQILCRALRAQLQESQHRCSFEQVLRSPMVALVLGVVLLLAGGMAGAAIHSWSHPTRTVTTYTTPTPTSTLSIAKRGKGSGTVTSSDGHIDCGEECTHTYKRGAALTLTATPVAGSMFTAWGGACTGTGTCRLTMDADKRAVAVFSTVPATLSVAKTGEGTVTSSDGHINCGEACTHTYTRAETVTLTATAGTEARFTGWSGACSGTGTCQLTIDTDKRAVAVFSTVPATLSVAKTGEGTVTSSDGHINCGEVCTHTYTRGAVVTLTANATARTTARTEARFTGWSGACTGTGACQLTLNANESVTAEFTAVPG